VQADDDDSIMSGDDDGEAELIAMRAAAEAEQAEFQSIAFKSLPGISFGEAGIRLLA